MISPTEFDDPTEPSAAAWTLSLHRVGPAGTSWRSGRAVGDHWDWFFDTPVQSDRRLRTWSTPPLGSGFWSGRYAIDCPATELPMHRAFYLQFSGPLSDDRGVVTPLVGGTYWTRGGELRLGVDWWTGGAGMRVRFYRINGLDRLRITPDWSSPHRVGSKPRPGTGGGRKDTK